MPAMNWRHAVGTICPWCLGHLSIVYTGAGRHFCPRCKSVIPADKIVNQGEAILEIREMVSKD